MMHRNVWRKAGFISSALFLSLLIFTCERGAAEVVSLHDGSRISSLAEQNRLKMLQTVSEVYPNILPEEREQFLRILFSHSKQLEKNGKGPSTSRRVKKEEPIHSFNCSYYPPSPQNPTSVNEVRPGDIKVIGAMGDSLTAAFGALATYYWDLFTEYRGASWSVGGDADVTTRITVPNMLKIYNPNLLGFSVGTGDADGKKSHFNRAVTGSRAPAMPGQATSLVDRIKKDPKVNLQEDWKMITLWVGSNDLCDVCTDEIYNPDEYEKNIRAAIQILKNGLPKVILNLIQGINPTQLAEVNEGLCSLLHSYECPCGSSSDPKVRQHVTDTLHRYNERLVRIANDTSLMSDDFAVVIQPFLTETSVPRTENGEPIMDYFALDCFHFSGLSHEAAAVGLWNNLFQKVGHKTTKWTQGEPYNCPEEGQFVATSANSQS
eukprot:TRINITY_DN4819_c0_g1_i1.p1 TRINITY_DN4819_c0_g1~~TRINITY_DN4819_c0_g1_i1.p1  ORF type:complete len:434 (-),score=96.11 TRINITY_DN4819_c0_g1_i1:60-1361(-)